MRQYTALIFCVASVPAILLLPQVGWMWAFAAVLLAMLLLRSTQICSIMLPWNFVALGAIADLPFFPNASVLMGLLLLLLAAYAANNKRILPVAAVIFFIHIILYGILLGFSIPSAQFDLQDPKRPELLLSALAVIPCAVFAPKEEKLRFSVCLAVAAFAALTALAGNGDFYTAMKSVSILGAMERLEPLVSVAMTMGAFCLLGTICAANEKMISEKILREKKFVPYLNFLLGGACIWLSRIFGVRIMAIGTAIFWGLIPVVAQSLEKRKKFEKNEKNA